MAKSKKGNKKKKNLSDKKLLTTLKSKVQSKHVNPFEVHLNRQKHKILGQRLKNDKGLPGVSRAKSTKKRKETLLHEFNVRNKSNAFIDRRIGEKDSLMSLDHKMLARFASEKKKQQKNNIFNLNEDEELTHQGQSLSEIERFDDPRSDSEDEDKLGADFVDDAHFGGFLTKKNTDANDGESKSRAEIIDEMIAKSKKKKHEQKAEREATMDLTDKLDSQWKEMTELMLSFKRDGDEKEENKADDFDVTIRELKFEVRGKATDKLKTEEELALEEKDKLEKLEEERLRRMKGLQTEDDAPKHKSADDIDDGFMLEDQSDLVVKYDDDGRLVGAETASDDEDDNDQQSEDEDDNEEDSEDGNEDDQEDEEEEEEDGHSDLESSENEDEENEEDKTDSKENKTKDIKEDLMKRKKIMDAARKEVPYTFKVPDTIEQLHEILEPYDTKNKVLVIQRMIKCNHPSLNANNKSKLENLFIILLLYLLDQVSRDQASADSLNLLDKMTPYLYDLNEFSPENNGHAILVILNDKREIFTKNLKKKGRANVDFPEFYTLVLLQLLPLLYSASDFRHAVITPALIFLTQILASCKMKTLKDVFFGLYLCTICKSYIIQSKRYIPEVMTLLKVVLSTVHEDLNKQCGPVLGAMVAGKQLLRIDDTHNFDDSKKVTISEFVNSSKDSNAQIKLALTKNALSLLKSYLDLYAEYASYRQIAGSYKNICSLISSKHLSSAVQKLCKSVMEKSTESDSLAPLQWQKKKAPSIKMLEPRIEEDFDGRKKMKGSKQDVEKKKLLHKYKQEMKGAMREIRKDNQFLARELLNDQLERDKERKRKVKKLLGELASQEGDYQAIKRKKNAA